MTDATDATAAAAAAVLLLARATNRSVASAGVLVVGCGPVAAALARVLARSGARVTVTGSDAAGLRALAAEGVEVLHHRDPGTGDAAVPATATVVVATGEAAPPLTTRSLTGGAPTPVPDPVPTSEPVVLLDVSPDGSAVQVDTSGGEGLRPGLVHVVSPGRPAVLVSPTRSPTGSPATGSPATGSAASWRRGQDAVDWAAASMPVTRALTAEAAAGGALRGLRIGLVLVLEPKTAVLALQLAQAGAEVAVMCGAATTDDDAAAALDHAGVTVLAGSDATPAQDREHALALLDLGLDVLVDDGSCVTRLAHTDRQHLLGRLLGATEETTSGLRPLRVMQRSGALAVPVLAVNDARCKTVFDNGHGTGQSTLYTTLDLLGWDSLGSPAQRHVVVAGYGWVGRGVARHARALGARVTVTEVDRLAALEAVFAGYRVAPLAEAAADADLLVCATGVRHTVDVGHLLALPEGAAVSVAGGVPQELALDAAVAAGARREPVAAALERFHLPNGRSVLVLDDGGCINCSAGEGNPIEVMDLSFGVQVAAVEHLARHGRDLAPAVHLLPPEVDQRVAHAKLAALGLGRPLLDSPSPAQTAFLGGWR